MKCQREVADTITGEIRRLAVKDLGSDEKFKKGMKDELKEKLSKDERFLYQAQLNLFQAKKGTN